RSLGFPDDVHIEIHNDRGPLNRLNISGAAGNSGSDCNYWRREPRTKIRTLCRPGCLFGKQSLDFYVSCGRTNAELCDSQSTTSTFTVKLLIVGKFSADQLGECGQVHHHPLLGPPKLASNEMRRRFG